MATKSRVRKKNGKPVKYKPKPKGMSKTKMKKLMEMLQQQQEDSQKNSGEIPEIREGEGQLLISPEFIKKLNVNPSDEIKEGPELSEKENNDVIPEIIEDTQEKIDEEEAEGPVSSQN